MGAALSALIALIPLISKLIGLFVKTPEQKREAVLLKLINLTQDLAVAVDASEDGDTSKLEKLLNKR